MPSKSSKANSQSRSLNWLFVFIPLLAVTPLLIVKKIMALGLNSDSLYLYCLYQDVFVTGYSFHDWTLSPAPCLFPDMALYFPMLAAVRRLGPALLLYGFTYLTSLFVLFYLIARLLTPSRRTAAVYVVTGLLFFTAFLISPYGLLIDEFMFVPGRHAGIILPGLLLLYLSLRASLGGIQPREAIVSFLLAVLGTASDVSLATQFIAPILLAWLTLCAIGAAPYRVWLIACLVLGCGSVSGLVLEHTLVDHHIITAPLVLGADFINPSRITTSFHEFIHSIVFYLIRVKPDFGVLTIASLSLCGWVLWKIYEEGVELGENNPISTRLLFLSCYFIISLCLMAAAPILTGIWFSWPEVRYLIPFFLFAAMYPFLFMTALNGRLPHWFKLGATVIVISFACWRIVPPATLVRGHDFDTPYPAKVQFIDSIAAKYKLAYGYSQYWVANLYNALKHTETRINQLHEKMVPYFWINSTDAYFGKPGFPRRYPEYGFIVMDGLPREEIRERFGDPSFVETGPDCEIWIYNRPEDLAFRQFIHPFFLYDSARRSGYFPAHPYPLTLYKAPGVPWNFPGTVDRESGGTVDVYFPPDAGVNMIDISLDSSEEYEIEFFERGAVEIPLHHTLMVPKPFAKGMAIHYLPLPAPIIGKDIERLRISSTTRYGRWSAGHVYLFRDEPYQLDIVRNRPPYPNKIK
ncbi:MAG: hypothetical protein GC154_00635 [bacterium]|nr:hypothetical protein [bacterium]